MAQIRISKIPTGLHIELLDYEYPAYRDDAQITIART